MNRNDCGCCAGVADQTDVAVTNRPGLTALAYRVGTQAQFKQRMLARLSTAERSALAGLQTRQDDDFAIALLDAWATVADVLTFYQERIANESYLRTAAERLSLVHLARLIGYELQPGVAASTYLAFTLEEAPGAPIRTSVDSGVKVQSIPGPGENPQTFETVETIEARPAWNALKPRPAGPQQLEGGLRELYLAGVDTQLHPGDGIVMVGSTGSEFRVLQTVTPDLARGHTHITWEDLLDSVTPPLEVLALRQRAALFGHNAPDPNLLSTTGTNLGPLTARDPATNQLQWLGFQLPTGHIDLDTVYPRIVPGSWVVLATPDDVACCRVQSVTTVSRAQYALSARVSRIVPDVLENPVSRFPLRETAVFVYSEALPTTDQPITTPVTGDQVTLGQRVEGLAAGRLLVFAGQEARTGVPVREVVTLLQTAETEGLTTLIFTPQLGYEYARDSLTINANVARATHGETVQDILGSGDASQPYQRFPLRQAPLTHVSAPTASGATSTLQVRVNDVLWQEVSTLLGAGPHDHVYVTRTDAEGKSTIQFGDGSMGARLPTGQDNVRATYRKGLGLEGMVQAEQLSLLLTRPLGVKAVTNPHDASGAADAESFAEVRRNAPLTVLTLDRAVSLQDYEDFAHTFAGIAKALATWIWEGRVRSILLTIAGPNGVAIRPDSALYNNLLVALRRAGNAHLRLRLESYRPVRFRTAGKVQVDPVYQPEAVLSAVAAALRRQFAFEARAFGQAVTLSEVLAVMHAVPGVVGVDLDHLYRTDTRVALHDRLLAALPTMQADGTVVAAELLTLDAAPLALEVMP
jgi:predicted phage baseplate assembly protein